MIKMARRLALLLCLGILKVPPAESFSPSLKSTTGLFNGSRPHFIRYSAVSSARSCYSPATENVDICIIGGGVSGLAAAITAAEKLRETKTGSNEQPPSVLLLESEPTIGGRVRSDITADGFTLDRGFAVFIEEYPTSKKLLDYDDLGLKQFLPGARVKLPGRDKLASVSDPLRRRRDLLKAIFSPVGSLQDKIRLVPLFSTVVFKSIEELFAMEETDALTCLKKKYRFSDGFISSFFAPFLEGIYLTPLENQSSRMFHFIFRMFTLGSASLPAGGMQTVSNQLERKASNLGVDICLNSAVLSVIPSSGGAEVEIQVNIDENQNEKITVCAKTVIIATDVAVARQLLGKIEDLSQINSLPELSQRSVGCIYYGFRSPAPLVEPILILNGEGSERRNVKEFPINNVCFPSLVQKKGYSPDGYDLCSVSILENALAEHSENFDLLDASIRKQLATWFPEFSHDIMDESLWVMKGSYVIKNAQPAHFNEFECANAHGGRNCSTFYGVHLPQGIFICGDYMATSTLNGALESGVNAGNHAVKLLTKQNIIGEN